MRRTLTAAGAALMLGIGVSAAVALGAGGRSSGVTTTTAESASKVWVCHHTGSSKHPYVLIHISTHALPAHLRHGDATPGPGRSCPTAQPPGAKTHGHVKPKEKQAPKGDADADEPNDD